MNTNISEYHATLSALKRRAKLGDWVVRNGSPMTEVVSQDSRTGSTPSSLGRATSVGPMVGTITNSFFAVDGRSTYVGPGMKGAGPTSEKPMMMRRQPIAVANLGVSFLSHNQPQQGAVRAYVPPLMTNMRPSTIGGRSNWRRWGSSVACRNPMLMDVTMMLDAASSTPGILSTCSRLAVGDKRRLPEFSLTVQLYRGREEMSHGLHQADIHVKRIARRLDVRESAGGGEGA